MKRSPGESRASANGASGTSEKWDRPRQRFSSVAEIVDELQAIAREALELDIADTDAVSELAKRASDASCELETFSTELEEARYQDAEDSR